MANNNDALQQILRYETTLVQKMLNLLIKILTNFKTGISAVLNKQNVQSEKVAGLLRDIDKIQDEQDNINTSIKSLENELVHQRTSNMEYITNLKSKIIDEINQINEHLRNVEKNMIESFNISRDEQSKMLISLIKEQINAHAQKEQKEIESQTDIRKEKIKQKFALWTAIAIGVIGGIFGLIQLILKMR